VNAALNGLTFFPAAEYSGSSQNAASLRIQTSD
jgi:hypothetical protein